MDELKVELEAHIQKLEFKTLGNKFKKLAPFRKILKTQNDQETVKEIQQLRQIYTKNYTNVKNEYNSELYLYLNNKLELRIENYEK